MTSEQVSLTPQRHPPRRQRLARFLAAGTAMCFLAACENGGVFPAFMAKNKDEPEVTRASRSVKLIERDVEAPDVFQVTESGLWDGRPSLGGIWVAHPDVDEPERVIIRNPTSGKFVIGALFRKERANPGPRLQVSSDAASALGLVAGQPADLNVTALRREKTPEMPETPETLMPASLAAPDAVTATELDPVAETAAAAIESAPVAAHAAEPLPAAALPDRTTNLSKPYLQIGIFSIEKNAQDAAATMRSKGLIPAVREQSREGKPFWRVLVGPATTSDERDELLKNIKAAGFNDAYAVTS